MRRMKKTLAIALSVCLLLGTYGGDVLAMEVMPNSDQADRTIASETNKTVQQEDEAGTDGSEAGKSEKKSGEEADTEGTPDKTDDVENGGSGETTDGVENGGSGEITDGAENGGSGETTDSGEDGGSGEITDGEEDDGSGETTGDEENDGSGEKTDDVEEDDPEGKTDVGEDETPAGDGTAGDESGLPEEDTSVSENSVSISENSLPRYYAASAETEGNFSYTVDSKTNTVTLNGYAGNYAGSAELYIPAELGG